MCPVEYHEIGTPRKNCTKDGFLYVHREGNAEWTGSLFEAIVLGDYKPFFDMKDWTVLDTAKNPEDGTSLVHYAAACGNEAILDVVLKRMQRPHDPDIKEGIRPLSMAARYGWSAIVKKLIASGALIAAVDKQGNTCIHEAARFAQNKCLFILLETVTGTRLAPLLSHVLWMKNIEGHTCYEVAINQGHRDSADMIMKYMRHSLK
jgi:hypothetical protein